MKVWFYLQLLKRKIVDENMYFALQLLFIWAFFKILGLFGVSFLYRIVFSLFFSFVLLKNWTLISCYVVNNIVFQYYVCLFLHVINCLINFKLLSFLLACNFSLLYGLFNDPIVFSNYGSKNLLILGLDLVFLSLFLFGFINKLCNNLFYAEMKEGLLFSLLSPDRFTWDSIIEIFKSFFREERKIKNKISITFLNSMAYKWFPFKYKFLEELTKPENNFLSLFKEFGSLREPETEKEFESFRVYAARRSKNLSKFIEEHRQMNNNFYKLILFGFFFGFLLAFVFLNYCNN